MKLHKNFFIVATAGLLVGSISCDLSHEKNLEMEKETLRKKIETEKKDLYYVFPKAKIQERDSIARFDSISPNNLLLKQKQQEKLDLQIKIAKLVEQSLREYWLSNFAKYKEYINNGLSDQDIIELSEYVGVAHFSLSCDIDTNYYNSLNDILYGPYWREFAEFADTVSPNLARKYKKVRQSAEKKYPFIHMRSVFYDGQTVAKSVEKPSYKNQIFTDAFKIGRDKLREQSVTPDLFMYDFNKMRNVSKVFTADIHFMIESIFLLSGEYIDLETSLFKQHYSELLDLVNQVIVLNPEIRKLNAQHETDIKKIKDYFDDAARQQAEYKSAEIKVLQSKLESFDAQNTR